MPLGEAEIARHARQLLLPGMGEAGQERLKAARVRVVGGGPAAGPALAYLAQAGVGTVWVDDPGAVVTGDASGWLWSRDQVGMPRAAAAAVALHEASDFVESAPYPSAGSPTAMLAISDLEERARAAAEDARRAGLPHVVAETNTQGGAVISVPPGAPCYSCAALPIIGGSPSPPDAAALGALAALELVLLIAGAGQEPRGRRIDLVRGQTFARPTSRQAGCVCAEPPVGSSGTVGGSP